MSEQGKRKFPRANYPCSLTVWLDNNFETLFAQTYNISAGGLLAYLDRTLMVGSKVELKISFSKTESFCCDGKVLRCEEKPKAPEDPRQMYAIAIIFEGLEDSKTAYLKDKVDKLLASEIKQ